MYSYVANDTVCCDFKQQPDVPSHTKASVYASSSAVVPSALVDIAL